MIEKSINKNGCSVCKLGEEKHSAFFSTLRKGMFLYQYDYRHIDGKLFSTVAPTLSECRKLRDKWLLNKSKKS